MSVAVATMAPRLVVEGAAMADLELALQGVRLPWDRLGGRLDDSTGSHRDDTLEVSIPGELVPSLAGAARVVLTDATCLPLAVLDEAHLLEGSDESAVRGRLHPDSRAVAPDWVAGTTPIAVAQRPLLDGDLDGDLDGPLLVLAPSGRSPDGVPAAVLRAALDAAVIDRPDVRVVDAPICWRDARSDEALLAALARAAGRDVRVLSCADTGWQRAAASLESGVVPADLHRDAAALLLRWRPPRHRRGVVVFFTGLSGSGKSTLAAALVERVQREGTRTVSLLDGDLVRRMLSAGLGFDRAGRDANVMRIGFVAAEIARHGGMAVCAPIAPFAEARRSVRQMAQGAGDFVLVHVATPIEVCEERDRKGLYAQARSGALPDFTGVSSPYEAPEDADLVVDTTGRSLADSLDEVVAHLRRGGWIA